MAATFTENQKISWIENDMSKIIVVESCLDCPHVTGDDLTPHRCEHTKGPDDVFYAYYEGVIHPDCPLPDAGDLVSRTKLDDIIIDVCNEILALPEDEFLKLLDENKNGDIAKTLLEFLEFDNHETDDLVSRKAVIKNISASLKKTEIDPSFWDDEETLLDAYNAGIHVAIGKIKFAPGVK